MSEAERLDAMLACAHAIPDAQWGFGPVFTPDEDDPAEWWKR